MKRNLTSARKRRAATFLPLSLIILLLAALVSGCGGSDSTSTDTSTGEDTAGKAAGNTDAALVAQSEEIIKAAETGFVTGPAIGFAKPTDIVPVNGFIGVRPTEAPSSGDEKSVTILSCTGAGTVCGNVAAIAQETFELFGWSAKVTVSGLTAPEIKRAMSGALQESPDAIVTLGAPALLIEQQLAQARAQGIKLVALLEGGDTTKGYEAYVPSSQNIQKEIAAAWAVAQSKGTANSAVMSFIGFDTGSPEGEAFLGECAGCTTDSVEATAEQYADPVKVKQLMSSVLASHDDLGYIFWPAVQFLEPALQAIETSPNPDVKILSQEGIPSAVPLVRDGVIEAHSWVPQDWIALNGVNATLMLIAGKEVPDDSEWLIGNALWTEENVPDADTFKEIQESAHERFDYLAEFEKAWGIDLSNLGQDE